MTPVETDTELCRIYQTINRAEGRIASWRLRLTADWSSAGSDWEPVAGTTMRKYHVAMEKYRGEIGRARAEAAPLEAEFTRRGGWTRYLVVPGGHYHHLRGCSSLRCSTYTLWTPAYSGKTAEEIVATLGEGACTKCFPDAPVATRAHKSAD